MQVCDSPSVFISSAARWKRSRGGRWKSGCLRVARLIRAKTSAKSPDLMTGLLRGRASSADLWVSGVVKASAEMSVSTAKLRSDDQGYPPFVLAQLRGHGSSTAAGGLRSALLVWLRHHDPSILGLRRVDEGREWQSAPDDSSRDSAPVQTQTARTGARNRAARKRAVCTESQPECDRGME